MTFPTLPLFPLRLSLLLMLSSLYVFLLSLTRPLYSNSAALLRCIFRAACDSDDAVRDGDVAHGAEALCIPAGACACDGAETP